MINVLSLFDGLGGARIALDQLGIECAYYASEVDKYAIKVSTANYPDIIQLGDVTQVKASDLPTIDLIVGGSPCQDLSVAKSNRKGLEGSRSGLFWEYVRLMRECKPKYFLLENVASMKREDRNIISKEMGVSPIMINSALVTAQNRKRYYWTNTGVWMQPMDEGIVLADIIEDGVADREKSYCLTATYRMDGLKHYKERKQRQVVFKGCAKRTYPRTPKEGEKREKKLEVRDDEKANALTSVQSDSMIFIEAEPSGKNTDLKFLGGIISGRDKWLKDGHDYSRNFSQANRVYSIEGKSSTLNAHGGGLGAKTGLYYTHEGIRKLTPLECERLQGIPDGYTDHVSNTQRYKMIGNGFTIPVIKHILKEMQL